MHSCTFHNFDTVNRISIWDGPASVLEDVRARCARYEALFSRFKQDSDIWRLNHAGGKSVDVAPETAALLQAAKDYCTRTGGSFDVTIGAVTRNWNFKTGLAPDSRQLAVERKKVDAMQLLIDGQQVRLPPGWAVDLGGIAKGYIADRLAEVLQAAGVTRATIDLGGNLVLLGAGPGNRPWRVGVQTPGAPVGESCAAILAQNRSVVTSGVYERGFQKDGQRFHHILDPKTGLPSKTNLLSVTLVTEKAVDGDVFATACLCLGLEGGKRLASCLPGAWALFITDREELQWFGPPENLLLGADTRNRP